MFDSSDLYLHTFDDSIPDNRCFSASSELQARLCKRVHNSMRFVMEF